ncbi:serine hydrolase domain-containing protein [Metabacillus halosaccharovorans]|uniref:serine hydrolase domain-containing protein n=1 Tax=Metabacillus halosaccharovorans TaxID=930124 RepID=UPI001C1F9A1C|nr:serine hydrolase domain-containing protein [Metabacillus halosaccharovorans]MBU7592756.1 beta-lactamase family protein [Metabacillus halosaccharovorans]
MKKIVLSILLFTLCVSPISVIAVSNNQAELIKEFMDNAIEEYNIPGASLVIIKDGDIVLQENWGVQSNGSPVTNDTLFTLGSVSKPLTSLGIMKLVEQKIIDLDQTINTYIPSFTYKRNGHENKITIRHLLTHTSGISSYEGLKIAELNLRGKDAINDAVQKLNNVELNHEPGEVHQYSAANYLLLGKIIENVSNQSFTEFMNHEIFSKLGMNQTVSNYKSASELGYQPGFQSWFGKPIQSENIYDDSGAPYGYISSTSNDMAKYIQFLIKGEGLLSKQNFETYIFPQISRKEDMYYGLGWRISTKEKDSYFFHGGETPDSRSELLINSEKNYGFLLLTNKNNISEVLQTTYMKEGIKAIIENGKLPESPKVSHQMQWMTLFGTIILALLSVWNLVVLKRKSPIREKLWLVVGLTSIICSIALIPVLTYIFGAPWHTINYYAPDTAFLIKCLVGLLVLNGFLLLSIIILKKKKRNFLEKKVHEEETIS